jgi:uncharacterized damage-inducible protein DinB
MARPQASTDYSPFSQTYISLAQGDSVPEIMTAYAGDLHEFYTGLPESKAGYAYAPGKWTIKDVLQHAIDSERVFTYRLLRIARGDSTPLPGFDEKLFAAHVDTARRSLDSLKEEFSFVRRSTDLLLASLNEEELQRRGTASDHPVTANALAFIIYGHLLHHKRILEERYL